MTSVETVSIKSPSNCSHTTTRKELKMKYCQKKNMNVGIPKKSFWKGST